MRGRQIQALAGHVSIDTTMRYMRVGAGVPADVIRALDARVRGGGVEAQARAAEKTNENGK